MRRQLLSTALAAAFAAAPLPAARAQVETAPRPKPAVTVAPRVEITPGLGPAISITPDIYVELPDIDIQVPPMPAVAPFPDDKWFPAGAPEIFVNGENVWFGGDEEKREETRQTYQLSPGARVEVSNINGPVLIDTADGQSAEVRITTYSASKNPRKLAVEHTGSSLSIRGAAKAERDRDDWLGSTRHHLRLTLPRRVNLSVSDVSDSVRVGELDGTVSFTNVSGRVGVAQAAGGAELTNVSGSATLTLSRLAGRGVTVKNVAGRVSIRFLEEVNAELQTSGIRGKVYVEVPNVAVLGEMNKADFRAKVGAGGPPINVSDVLGTVRLSPGQSVAEMLAALKSTDRNKAGRAQVVSDLALHVSNRQVRQAFIEALNSPEQNSALQVTAARELAPYVAEPEVRDAFLRALAAEPARNDAVKIAAVRAVAREHGGDKSVREALLRALAAADAKGSVRMTIVGAVAKYVEDPAVTRALVDVFKTDARDSTRTRAAAALSKRTDDAEVYGLLLEAARNDKNRGVRLQSLSGLVRRARERTELRELFLGYLDNESISFQYQALRGLVELNDPSLRQRLVEKGREIVLGQGRRYWNDRMVLDTILLIRRLDPQEADRLLEQLAAERTRTA